MEYSLNNYKSIYLKSEYNLSKVGNVMKVSVVLIIFGVILNGLLSSCIVVSAAGNPPTTKWSHNNSPNNFHSSQAIAADAIDNGVGAAGKPILEVFTAGSNYIRCYNGDTGAVVWEYAYLNEDSHLMQSISDIDNDSHLELLVFAYNEALCFNAESGENGPIWTYVLPHGMAPWNRRLDKQSAIVDADHTGYKYIYLAAEGYGGTTLEPTTVKLNYLGQPVAQSNYDSYTCWGGLAAADLDDDGTVEIVQNFRARGYPTAYGGVLCMDSNLNIKWNVLDIYCSSHPPAIADVDADGKLDVIAGYQGGSNHRGLYVIDGETGTIIHGSNDCGINVWNDMAVYDIDGDGHKEVISDYQYSETNPTPNHPTIFDLTTWSIEATLPALCWKSPCIANVDGNADDMEIICSGYSNTVIYDHNYNQLWTLNGNVYGSFCSPLVNDIDGDGKNEMVLLTGDTYDISVLDTEGITPTPAPRSSSTLANERRTNVAEYIPPPGEESETPKTINVISPNGGETWTRGSTQIILWSYSGNISNVKIELYKNGAYNSTISTSTINNGSFSWTITQNPETTYKVRITDTSNNTIWDESNNYFSIINTSNPPNSPTIDGPSWGITNVEYSFHINATETDGDDIYFRWNWGDGNYSEWLGPYSSNGTIATSHTWSQRGLYGIRAKLKDGSGAESNWSDLHTLTMYELKKAFLFGRYTNMITESDYITIEAINLRMILFKPFQLLYNIDRVTISMNNSKVLVTQRFIIGLGDVVI
jgi:hypothetical protein